MMATLKEKKKLIHLALCDNFNTPLAIKHLFELISKSYDYETKSKNNLKVHIIYSIAQFVAHITKSFGLIYRTEFIDFFIFDSAQGSTEQILAPFVDAMSKFRDNVKTNAAVNKDPIKILKICDEFRDDVLPYLGIKIEDKGKGVPSVWKIYEDKDSYIKELSRQKEIAEQKQREKEQQAKERELKNSTTAKRMVRNANRQILKI